MDLIGVVHLLPLPGSPQDAGIAGALARAEADARAWIEGGADALIVENFGDVPFARGAVEPVTVAAMTRAVERVRGLAGELPVGVNVLRNDAESALSIAHVCGACFVRVNVHVGAAVTDQGVIQSRAAHTLRLRRRLGAQVEIWADVAVKHAAPLGESDPRREARDAVERGLADALIVTGPATGERPDMARIDAVRGAVPDARLLAGSGVTPELAATLRDRVDGAIVGTWAKRDGRVDVDRVARLKSAFGG
jgi:uncharacterized protein